MKNKANVICEITPDYRIETDSYNWVLSKRNHNKKQDTYYWTPYKFYNSLGSLLVGALDMQLEMSSDLTNLKDRLDICYANLQAIGNIHGK